MSLGSVSVSLLATLASVLPVGAAEAARPLPARLCPEDAPDGVRLPPKSGCGARAPARAAERDGFRDIGGLKVRIGGRVGAEFQIR